MHRHRAMGCDYKQYHESTWAAVGGYGYFAPGRVAMDEQRERVMTDAARWRHIASSESAGGQAPQQSPRQFLRDLVIDFAAGVRHWGPTTALLRVNLTCCGWVGHSRSAQGRRRRPASPHGPASAAGTRRS